MQHTLMIKGRQMPYLVDGHNLIPHVPGINLADLDDEQALIDLLAEFCRTRRQKVEVFFDRAAPGRAGATNRGLLTATFVAASLTADEAIRRRLKKLGKDARNWKVVSSDRQVQAEALAAHATVVPSPDFAASLFAVQDNGQSPSPRPGHDLSPEELQEWLHLFKERKE